MVSIRCLRHFDELNSFINFNNLIFFKQFFTQNRVKCEKQ